MKELLASDRSQSGFTLIELIIVIVIIFILSVVGAVSFWTAQRNARNAERQSDLKSIQLALEAYFADHGQYPNTGGTNIIQKTYWGAYDGATQGTGRTCNTPDDTDESICCLFGGTTASNMHPKDINSFCSSPFNEYIPENSGVTRDPLFGTVYLYASDGQTYALSTTHYEGNPPEVGRFTRDKEPWYFCEMQDEVSSVDFTKQYYVASDTHREPTPAQLASPGLC